MQAPDVSTLNAQPQMQQPMQPATEAAPAATSTGVPDMQLYVPQHMMEFADGSNDPTHMASKIDAMQRYYNYAGASIPSSFLAPGSYPWPMPGIAGNMTYMNSIGVPTATPAATSEALVSDGHVSKKIKTQDSGTVQVTQLPVGVTAGDKYSVDSLKMREKKRLEQNREAAKRFRQKKKACLSDLQGKTDILEVENQHLKQERAILVQQLADKQRSHMALAPLMSSMPQSVLLVHMWWDHLVQLAARLKADNATALKDACDQMRGHMDQFPVLLHKCIQEGAAMHLINLEHCPQQHRVMLWYGFFRPSEVLEGMMTHIVQDATIHQTLQQLRVDYGQEEAVFESTMCERAQELKHAVAEQTQSGTHRALAEYILIMVNHMFEFARTVSGFLQQLQDLLPAEQFFQSLMLCVDMLSAFKSYMEISSQQQNLQMQTAIAQHAQQHGVPDKQAQHDAAESVVTGVHSQASVSGVPIGMTADQAAALHTSNMHMNLQQAMHMHEMMHVQQHIDSQHIESQHQHLETHQPVDTTNEPHLQGQDLGSSQVLEVHDSTAATQHHDPSVSTQ